MTAANDRRMKILARLDYLLGKLKVTLTDGRTIDCSVADVNGDRHFVHNRNELPANMVPGYILLDADETKDPDVLQARQGRQLPMGAQLMRMTPEIYAVLDVRKPANKNVGEDLNLMRQAVIVAVGLDKADAQGPSLSDICGSNGKVEFDAYVTDLARNRTMKGQAGISVTFSYPLFPQELVQQ